MFGPLTNREAGVRAAQVRWGGRTPEDRFWDKVDATGDCWVWTGGTGGAHGLAYGRLKWHGRHEAAHRVAYLILVGPIPDGLQIDHLCRNTLCVNPDHLEPVTASVNVRRAHVGGRCRHGHPAAAFVRGPKTGKARCKTCQGIAYRARVEREGAYWRKSKVAA